MCLPGNVIECGVAAGRTTFAMADFMAENMPGRTLYACDTFSGLPYGENDELKRGECDYGDLFKRVLAARKPGCIETIEGLVEDTLMARLSDEQFCFAWLDMDLYLPTSIAAQFLADRIVPGGFIGFHDYRFVRCPGIAEVADKEMDRNKYSTWIQADNCIFLKRTGEQ